MTGIVQRVRQLNLPLDQVVVIGSGVLDTLNLRSAGDVDLVVTPAVFDTLKLNADWTIGEKNGEPIATINDAEAFLSWGNNSVPNFTELYADSVVVDGVHFANPQFVIDWKRQRGSAKDLRDIALLERYLTDER